MRHIPAFRGEFGLKIRYHVPQVYTLCRREPCVVEIEEGEEALYPAAAEWRIVPRLTDHVERGSKGRPPSLGVKETRFVPEPHVPCTSVGPDFDAVVCPRWGEYGKSKNWWGWPLLTHWLMQLNGGSTLIGAAGAPDSSLPVPCGKAWENERRYLDLSIHMMRHTRLVIATDAGLAHLAVLCGAPLLLVTYRGRVAPGPVVSSSGKKTRDHYWPVRLEEYYHKANHTGSPIHTVDGWEDVGRVVAAAEKMMAAVA